MVLPPGVFMTTTPCSVAARHVYVIDANAGAPNHPQGPGRFNDFAGYLCFGAHQHRHHVLDYPQQLFLGMALRQDHDLELGPLLQQRDAFRGNRVTHQDFHKRTGIVGKAGGRVNEVEGNRESVERQSVERYAEPGRSMLLTLYAPRNAGKKPKVFLHRPYRTAQFAGTLVWPFLWCLFVSIRGS